MNGIVPSCRPVLIIRLNHPSKNCINCQNALLINLLATALLVSLYATYIFYSNECFCCTHYEFTETNPTNVIIAAYVKIDCFHHNQPSLVSLDLDSQKLTMWYYTQPMHRICSYETILIKYFTNRPLNKTIRTYHKPLNVDK